VIGASRSFGRSLATVIARGIGWMFLGSAVGVSEGIAARSMGKLSYGAIGGAIGGLVGGSLFAFFMAAGRQSAGTYAWGQSVGLVILGASIGALSALVQAVFQPASVQVLRGWQEGRIYPLLKDESVIGRDEYADVALFRDMRIEKRHIAIRHRSGRFTIVPLDGPSETTRLNGAALVAAHPLRGGDRIELGDAVLKFSTRVSARREPRRDTSSAPAAPRAVPALPSPTTR
jgi:hypothetical protein